MIKNLEDYMNNDKIKEILNTKKTIIQPELRGW